jgi:hypothetical protein
VNLIVKGKEEMRRAKLKGKKESRLEEKEGALRGQRSRRPPERSLLLT